MIKRAPTGFDDSEGADSNEGDGRHASTGADQADRGTGDESARGDQVDRDERDNRAEGDSINDIPSATGGRWIDVLDRGDRDHGVAGTRDVDTEDCFRSLSMARQIALIFIQGLHSLSAPLTREQLDHRLVDFDAMFVTCGYAWLQKHGDAGWYDRLVAVNRALERVMDSAGILLSPVSQREGKVGSARIDEYGHSRLAISVEQIVRVAAFGHPERGAVAGLLMLYQCRKRLLNLFLDRYQSSIFIFVRDGLLSSSSLPSSGELLADDNGNDSEDGLSIGDIHIEGFRRQLVDNALKHFRSINQPSKQLIHQPNNQPINPSINVEIDG